MAVLFCKSFRDDIDQAKALAASIVRHNTDRLPCVFAVPASDVTLFRTNLPSEISILAEEELLGPQDPRFDGWRQQQIIKLLFAHSCDGDCLAIDSDSYFVRDFGINDLFVPNSLIATSLNYDFSLAADPRVHILAGGTIKKAPTKLITEYPATPQFHLHGGKRSLLDRIIGRDPMRRLDVNDRRQLIPRSFGCTSCPHLHFLPSPTLFSHQAVHEMVEYLAKRELTVADLIEYSPWEADWHGHWVLSRHLNRFTAREPLFLHFSTRSGVEAARRLGVTNQTISINFFGVTMAARHHTAVL